MPRLACLRRVDGRECSGSAAWRRPFGSLLERWNLGSGLLLEEGRQKTLGVPIQQQQATSALYFVQGTTPSI